ncbi:hypothetical protein D5F01_LYC22444 [Larimichthys crocea]|uniref:Uncharacterized protein n=1 Tax=Larimichthys crocea TaxID=215358 RepID=A0A6G0HI42_LARCR|nr:hypothetical protein D5F01_LYC22444 [Larimichthys crocea]
MATADLLLELMFSWIDQRECCARQLKKLANELESLRDMCNGGECIGNSVSVVGAACLLGAGAATLFTGGAAAPFLGLLGGVYTGVGVTMSVVTKLTEHFVSSDTMKEAEKIEEKSNNIAQRIQKLFDQLKAEIKKVSPSADLDEVDRSVMTKLLGAMARRSALEMKIGFSKLHDMLHRSPHKGMNMDMYMQLNPIPKPIFNIMTSVVVGGAVGLAFAFPEAVDNWKEAIKNNHVTEASQSLKDTADAILKMTRVLREQFDNMRKMLVDMAEQQEQERIEMARRQREQERIEMVRRQREQERIEMARRQREQERIEMARRQRKQERIEMARRQREKERIEMAKHQQEQERIEMAKRQRVQKRIKMARRQQEQATTEKARRQREQKRTEKAERQKEQEQQNKQTGSEPQRGDDQVDKERDQEDEKSDQEDEESDQENEERQQNDRISDHYTISFKATPKKERKEVKVGLLNCR